MKNVMWLSSSRAFYLSTLILLVVCSHFFLSNPVDNTEATWKKATKSNKNILLLTKPVVGSGVVVVP